MSNHNDRILGQSNFSLLLIFSRVLSKSEVDRFESFCSKDRGKIQHCTSYLQSLVRISLWIVHLLDTL